MKHTSPLTRRYRSAWDRCLEGRHRRQQDWETRTQAPGLVITIAMPGKAKPKAKTAAKGKGRGKKGAAQAAEAAAATPVETFDPKSVTLSQILDTFGRLVDPHSRVFAGLFELPSAQAGSVRQRVTETGLEISAAPPTYLAPVIAGFAYVGSRIDVTYSDELGIPQTHATVYADERGHWIAQQPEGTYLSDTRSIFLEITPPLWSGATRAERFIVDFPSEALHAQGSNRPEAGGGVIGSVLEPRRAPDAGPIVDVPQW